MELRLQNLEYSTILSNISATFTKGIYGILGVNGAGKTTLLKLLNRIFIPTAGQITLNGVALEKISREQLSRLVILVPQAPPLSFNFVVRDFISMGLYPHRKLTAQEKNFRVEHALQRVNGSHLFDRHMIHLSVGERQRMYLARALATDSQILLLDEPTSHLDISQQLHIWEIIKLLRDDGKLILVSLHDLHAAERYCNRLLLLDQGQIKAQGTYTEIASDIHSAFGIEESSVYQSRAFTSLKS